jgi:L-ascorbate metabolism protein UlaG (beta-lactamase superfamily)
MKRRQLMQYAGASTVTALSAGIASLMSKSAVAQSAGGVSIQFLGHMSFLVSGGGQRMLVNPFRKLGCTAGYPSSKLSSDVVLISSQLLDEGDLEGIPGNPQILYEPGVYQIGNRRIQGIKTDHDRKNGRRFGVNTVWQWEHGGVKLLHLGGIAAPISVEQKILMGRPDVVFVPVGGGAKAYNAEEAKAALAVLNPKVIIPIQYKTSAADAKLCTIEGLDPFLTLMQGTPIKRVGGSVTLSPSNLPSAGTIYVMG